jgi:hypothetical protein
MKNVWLITDEHRLATLLHPKMKNFECCMDEKEGAIVALKMMIDKHRSSSASCLSNSESIDEIDSQSSSTPISASSAKRKNLLAQCFDTKVNVPRESSDRYQEMHDYLLYEVTSTDCEDVGHDGIDVLSFWKDKREIFPLLSSIARVIYSIPASNTMIERLFSASKNVVTAKRTSLDCEKVNQLLFLQKNLHQLKQFECDPSRKRNASTSSANTVSAEESFCTIPKQQRLNTDDSYGDSTSTDADILLD